ncbi:hypothetical protein FA13DRAFT_202544 [Coprinellus micaceus]|uniref:Uncharacterized protein n=1 Tax=Coprinellus micaceus TaxID=71717 RepID=A0A4Y7SHM2_COPMI|nr:hypothetical protein FA13DRAFT_202544 [Coprinellus micaceus]
MSTLNSNVAYGSTINATSNTTGPTSTVGARPMGARAPVVSPKSTAQAQGTATSISSALAQTTQAQTQVGMGMGMMKGGRMPVRQRTLSASSISGSGSASSKRPVVSISTALGPSVATPSSNASSSTSRYNANSGYNTDSGGKMLSAREKGKGRDRGFIDRDPYGGHSGYVTSTPSSPTLITPTAITGRRNLPIPGNQSSSGTASGGGVTPTSGRPLGASFTVGSIPIPSLPVGGGPGGGGGLGIGVGVGGGAEGKRMVRPLPLPGGQQQQQQQAQGGAGVDRGTSPSPRLPFSPVREFGSPPAPPPSHPSYPRDILGSREGLTRERERDQSRGAGSTSSAMSSPPSSAFGSPNMGTSMVGSVSSVTSASSGSVLGSDAGLSRHPNQYPQQSAWLRQPHPHHPHHQQQTQPLQPQRRHRSPTTGYHPHGAFNVRSGMAIPAPASPVTGPGQAAFLAQSPPRQPWVPSSSGQNQGASAASRPANAAATALRAKRRYDTYGGFWVPLQSGR